MGLFDQLHEVYERELFVRSLKESERALMDSVPTCECAAAPTCPLFRRAGELFDDEVIDRLKPLWHQERR